MPTPVKVQYPALRLFFRGSESVIDVPNPEGISTKDDLWNLFTTKAVGASIEGKDGRGNPVHAVVDTSELAFAAIIVIEETVVRETPA